MDGGTARIFMVTKKNTGEIFTLKYFCNVQDGKYHEPGKIKYLPEKFCCLMEIYVLQLLKDCPRIVNYEESLRYTKNNQDYLFLFKEYMPTVCYSLVELKGDRPFCEESIAYILLETMQALRALHERNIVCHGVRSDDILFDDDGTIKLLDFNLAIQLTKINGTSTKR